MNAVRPRFLKVLLAESLVFALAATVLVACAPRAKADDMRAPACNLNPCVITEDDGGIIRNYLELADRLKATGWKVKVDGFCYSACTVLMDRARPLVCITTKATLFIHRGTAQDPTQHRFDVSYSADLSSWIKEHGGQPSDGWLVMPSYIASQFWPAC